jgi:hypothetical protein
MGVVGNGIPSPVPTGEAGWGRPRDQLLTALLSLLDLAAPPLTLPRRNGGEAFPLPRPAGDGFSPMPLRNGTQRKLVDNFSTSFIASSFEGWEYIRAPTDHSGFILDFVRLIRQLALG